MASLVQKMLKGDKASLSKLITLIENDHPDTISIMKEIFPHAGRAHIIGITGFPGAGKSTTINRLIATYRQKGLSVGVVAVDPSSPLSGGAILGDRVRMKAHHKDEGVFIRSMATRGFWGGLARNTHKVMELLDAFGFDKVIVETVGVGQDEVDIVGLAHTSLLVLTPGLGDETQAIKSGVFEVADIFVINKIDEGDPLKTLGILESVVTTNRSGVNLPRRVIMVSAIEDKNMDGLVDALENHHELWKRLGPEERLKKFIGTDVIVREALMDLFKNRLGQDYDDFKRMLINRKANVYTEIEKIMYAKNNGTVQDFEQ